MILFICGLPATGKTTFANHLTTAHGFVHYDLERFPEGWPHVDLHDVWDRSRKDFVAAAVARHKDIALNWGFPPACLAVVSELVDAGCKVVWLGATAEASREAYVRRGSGTIDNLDTQLRAIQDSDLPRKLPHGSMVVEAFGQDGLHVDSHSLCGRLGVG